MILVYGANQFLIKEQLI